VDTTKIALHVFVEIEGEMVAVCQRRGEYNFEELDRFGRVESWRNGLQPFVAGKMKQGETSHQTLTREIAEEAGYKFFNEIFPYLENQAPLLIGPAAHWGIVIKPQEMQLVAWHSSSGGARIIRRDEVNGIQDLKEFKKHLAVSMDMNAMFVDEKEAMIQLWPKQE